jgi:hypothetical protein
MTYASSRATKGFPSAAELALALAVVALQDAANLEAANKCKKHLIRSCVGDKEAYTRALHLAVKKKFHLERKERPTWAPPREPWRDKKEAAVAVRNAAILMPNGGEGKEVMRSVFGWLVEDIFDWH